MAFELLGPLKPKPIKANAGKRGDAYSKPASMAVERYAATSPMVLKRERSVRMASLAMGAFPVIV